MPAKTTNINKDRPVMMPGRTSGSSTRRRNRDLPGKLARSRASAARRPRVSERTTAPRATRRLFSTESQMGPSAKSWRYQSSVKCLGGKPPTPVSLKE